MTRDPTHVFVRVYLLPEDLTKGYCFGPGIPITFTNVDWFYAPIVEGGRVELTEFIRVKSYFRPNARFLVLGDHTEYVFTIDPEVVK